MTTIVHFLIFYVEYWLRYSDRKFGHGPSWKKKLSEWVWFSPPISFSLHSRNTACLSPVFVCPFPVSFDCGFRSPIFPCSPIFPQGSVLCCVFLCVRRKSARRKKARRRILGFQIGGYVGMQGTKLILLVLVMSTIL